MLTTSPQGERRLEHSGVLATYSAIQMLIPGSGFGFVLLSTATRWKRTLLGGFRTR